MFLNFGGFEFVPPAIAVRTFGEKNWHTSAVAVSQTRYNDFVPLVYGTAWYTPPVVFARNDGNLTRMEVLLGLGEMQGVLKVLVNDVEIPLGAAGTNMTATGWYNIPTLGTRTGKCNEDFKDGSGQPAGDPYGSMAYLAVAVPNRLNDGTSLPRVKVLVQGLKLPVYDTAGGYLGEQFTSNPAWILLDVLRRTGWRDAEIDIPSFATVASYCDGAIDAVDIYGNPISLARFQCNLVLQHRRSAGDVVRGVRTAARLMLSYGCGGGLQLRVENTAALEHPERPEWSNSSEPLNGGWPSYEFGDGTGGFSGILRKAGGEPSVRVYTRSMADTPNRYTVEFQDALNEYQQDSFSLVDAEDVARSGQEVSATLSALGIANYDQAARVLKVSLDKSVRGNTYVEFATSVKAFGVRPGDLISVTYLKEGWDRQAFRVLKIAPGLNHRVTTIAAQIHDDAWYADSNGQVATAPGGRRPGGGGLGVPKPLLGGVLDEHGDVQFGVTESATMNSDGTAETSVAASFVSPAIAESGGPAIPMLSLVPHVTGGGSLGAGQILYYAISAVDSGGSESALSFIVRAVIATDASSVTLSELSFGPGTSAFHVYRGNSPAQLYRIASDQAPAAQFTDTGLEKQLIAPPDPNFDHANFYWRLELQPEIAATVHSLTTIGNDALQMAENRYRGMIARIMRGRGAGQERAIAANSAQVLTVSAGWEIAPDATSYFVVAESSWRFGALTKSSPAQFTIPNRSGEVVHISGRAASVNDVECAAEISTVTRWLIGGSGGPTDSDVPAQPSFGVGVRPSGGVIEFTGVSFQDLTNTRTISSATFTLYYWDELNGDRGYGLAQGVTGVDVAVDLNSPWAQLVSGMLIQVNQEIMRIDEVQNGGGRLLVTRGVQGTTAVEHAALSSVYELSSKAVIAPFPLDFFGSPYSGNWSFPVSLPNVRLASAELFVTNERGNSETRTIHVTETDDSGLRTRAGGQYSIQVDGYLAVEQTVAAPLVVEAPHTVTDIYAVLGQAADSVVQLRLNVNGAPYCTLSFQEWALESGTVNGLTLPPLEAEAKVTLSVLSVGSVYPGADLTVVIRL
jgi:hypothetical protein